MTLTVGIDEVGYGPSLGPLVVAAAAAPGPLPPGVRIGDSKKVFSQARGVGSLEPGKQMDAVIVHGPAINLIRVGADTIRAVVKRGGLVVGT